MITNRKRAAAAVAALVTTGLVVSAGPAFAAPVIDSAALTDAITAEGIIDHLEALQAVATANGGNRGAGLPGYTASAVYVEGVMQAAGYTTTRQPFEYDRVNYTSATLEQVAPVAEAYELVTDFYPMSYAAPNADVTAAVTAVDVNITGDRLSTSGCESADFAGFPIGDIALIQRGTCAFALKVDNAAAAGASAVVIFNQGNVNPDDDRFGVFNGTLDPPVRTIPAVSMSFDLGAALVPLAQAGTLDLRLAVTGEVRHVETFNVIAEKPTVGRADRTVLVGAHLDSVPEGPGINDNGSGTAALLEIAEQLSALGIDTRNRVRFAFWGGEEDGLLGSEHYVAQLTKAQIKQHAVNLNFDMLGSPNGVPFVYDGDGSAFGLVGPNGSDIIEKVFTDYLGTSEPTAFDGRSDYFAFINAGIPAGGLFSGAEGIKSPEEAVLYGGTAGAAYDPGYHAPCDDILNIDPDILESLTDAAAHATLTFAQTTSAVNGTAKGQANGQIDWEMKGDRALR